MKPLKTPFDYQFSLDASWIQNFVKMLGATMTGNVITYPEEIATGKSYYLEVMPGVSAFISKLVINTPLQITHTPSDNDRWIVYYDLSERFVKQAEGYTSKIGFGILDSKITNTYASKKGDHLYFLRLIISKDYLKEQVEHLVLENDYRYLFESKNKKLYYYGHIDSRSKVIIHELSNQNMDDTAFEFKLKSATYNLLGFFLERIGTSNLSLVDSLYEKDLQAIMLSQEFLLSDLKNHFPGIEVLSQIANMSVSRFTKLYRIVFGMSPFTFFKNEKLVLAKILLEEGKFKLVKEVSLELGYYKTSYFSSIFKDYYGYLPSALIKPEFTKLRAE